MRTSLRKYVPTQIKLQAHRKEAKEIKITSWLVRAYDFYSRVVKDNKTNKRASEFVILHNE